MLTKKDDGHEKSLWCIGRVCRQGLVKLLSKELFLAKGTDIFFI